MTTDVPDEPDDAAGTPGDVPEHSTDEVPAPAHADELPEAPPQVQLIDASDLSWVDRPQETEEHLERRRLRREAHKEKVRRKRRKRKVLRIIGITMISLLVLAGTWFQLTLGGLGRMPSSHGQAGLNTPGTTMLLIGRNPAEAADAAVTSSGWRRGFASGDLVMLLHLTRDHRSMFVISIPADSVLPIPGGGSGKLADAYTRGGQNLYVRTIETYTGIAMDRVAVMDMNALREITDILDGVVVTVPRPACQLPAGPRRLDGQQTLDFMALPTDCPEVRDLDRVERQQLVLRSLMRGAVDGGKVTNPFTLNRLLHATASNLTLEKGFSYPSMAGMLWSMRGLRTSNTTFLTMPVADSPYGTDGSVLLDHAKDAPLWDALRRDRIADYLALDQDATVLR
ncbi:MAG: transcriptional regulator [Marmoricola sp.]|nr:transcriptional regulator [Marmoricola sp.]